MQVSGFASQIPCSLKSWVGRSDIRGIVSTCFDMFQLPEELTRAAAAIEAQGFVLGALPRMP